LEKKFNIPIGYEEDFKKADLTFLHQRVYDPVTKQLVPLTPFPDEILQNTKLTDLDFIGPEIDHDILMKIVSGIVFFFLSPSLSLSLAFKTISDFSRIDIHDKNLYFFFKEKLILIQNCHLNLLTPMM
jgi:hypothetical protein